MQIYEVTKWRVCCVTMATDFEDDYGLPDCFV